ncbi:type VII toxin-antitoxin system MntA family adenylyltransferase antitoxin [Dehalobacterium formicoaceticum]|uniref:Nucleotidyltransferase domain-containing protein n=1 Tax=Dehalobacterium formicoaceticum TaxID=51515 RepID=A0ABT1Y2I8_9FIRM|nr:nucleotidyltransferase domain-containing protein [Dehalobacterium formicoaceticum]MCR6545090.1 nucleotidyltransferase domain-containing protein [Dehalobacterium formicoaceticum]
MQDRDIELIKQYLIKKISPDVIYIFGSAVKGVVHRDSDIDIAFLSNKNIDSYDVFIIGQELADILNKRVDLVDLGKSSTVFQSQVVGKGKIVYCKDELRRMNYELLVLKKYARLNEERKDIIDKIIERGTVYGK